MITVPTWLFIVAIVLGSLMLTQIMIIVVYIISASFVSNKEQREKYKIEYDPLELPKVERESDDDEQ